MTMYTVRIFHISDLHERAGRETARWRRYRVLGEDAWKPNLDALLEDGKPDLLCFTGDLADWGRPGEYAELTPFLENTWTHMGVPHAQVFVVPGNHDVDRKVEEKAWRVLRTKVTPEEDRQFSEWMAGGSPLRGIPNNLRDDVLLRQSAWRTWLRDTLKRPEMLAGSIHPRLGYRVTLSLTGKPFPIHVVGLDSAWLAGDDHDQGNLRLTDAQVGSLTSAPKGGPLDGFRVALMHHPLDHLADANDSRRRLAERVDLLLRGHLHEPDPSTWKDVNRELQELPAGCLYQHDRYPNSCHMLTATLDASGRPLRYELRTRVWSSNASAWVDDNSLSSKARSGRLTWWEREDAPSPSIASPPVPGSAEVLDVLSQHFRDIPRIRMLLNDAGIDIARVPFSRGAGEAWAGAIEVATHTGRLGRLLALASQERPDVPDLQALASRLTK